MLFVHCCKCEQLLGSSYLFCFSHSSEKSIELVLKSSPSRETLVTLLSKLIQSNAIQNEYDCRNCSSPICNLDDETSTLQFKNTPNTVYFRELVYGKYNYLF